MRTDLDVLTNLGLMYFRESVIEIPQADQKHYFSRLERRISRIGRQYVSERLLTVYPEKILENLKSKIEAVLNKEKTKIIESLAIEGKEDKKNEGELPKLRKTK